MIIPFDNSDAHYTAYAHIWSTIFHHNPESAESVRNDDKDRDAKFKYARYFWQEQGELVGMALYVQQFWNYRPNLFDIYVFVLPDYRKKGIGTALYEHLMAQLAPHEPTKLVTLTVENKLDGIRFVEQRGFKPAMRYIVSTLQVDRFDAGLFSAERERFDQSPYTIQTLRQLREVDPENYLRKLHALKQTLTMDVPAPDELKGISYQAFAKQFQSPNMYPDGVLVALDGDQCIGMTEVWQNSANPERLNQYMTGTLPAYRRQGIALVLKLHAIEFAQRIGKKIIHTDNEENNPMYLLNLKLGFEPEPAEIEFVKQIVD